MKRFQGKIAVVTGGNSGIGLCSSASSFVVGSEIVIDGGMTL